MIFMGELYREFFEKSGLSPATILERQPYYVRQLENRDTEAFQLEYFWVAEIFYFQNNPFSYSSPYTYNELMIAFIKSDLWCKSIVLIPELPTHGVPLDKIQSYSSQLFDVDSEIDLFVPYLQSTNIKTFGNPNFMGDRKAYNCNIQYQTNLCRGGIKFSGPVQPIDKGYEALWKSLLSTVNSVVDLSENPVIKDFIQEE